VRPSTRISTLGNAANTIPIDRNSTPKKLSQLFRGELDWIVMKALEKDRNRRYESAGAFANDVQRFLNGEVVQACPPTAGYRLKKNVRQHKAALATAAMVLTALAIGTGVAVWQAVVATRAEQ
jgi:eukaryotic-like serine/threonine-protein kinase